MKRLFLYFAILIFIKISAYCNPIYSIKLGTYKNIKHAKQAQKKIQQPTYIEHGNRFYGLYSGYYDSFKLAKKNLKTVKSTFHDAFIIKKKNIVKPIKVNRLEVAKRYYQLGAYETALAEFDKILIDEPNNNLARLEYARTLFKLGFYKDATDEFKQVLKKNPPQFVKQNINNYLKKIKSLNKKHFFYGSIGIDLTYDDNLEFNTYTPTTIYGGLLLQNDTDTTKGFYEVLNFSLFHTYIGEKFIWQNRLYSYNEIQNKDIDNLNFLSYQTSISKATNNTKVILPLTINSSWLGGKSYSNSLLTTPTLLVDLNRKTQLSINIKLQNRRFSKDSSRDYNTYGTKLLLTKLYDKLTLYTSGAWEDDVRKEKSRFDVSRKRVFLSSRVYYQILKNSLIHFGYLYNIDMYSISDPALGYKREDKKYQYSATFKQNLSKNSSTTLSYQKLINDSNINLYSYKKSSYSLSYRYSF